ncbi:hypothetical protein ACVIKO_006332 [Rhizobium ruizarguesonis]
MILAPCWKTLPLVDVIHVLRNWFDPHFGDMIFSTEGRQVLSQSG